MRDARAPVQRALARGRAVPARRTGNGLPPAIPLPHSGRSLRAVAAALVLAALVLALNAGCGVHRAGPAPVETPAARAQALVEAGNRAYRAGDYRLAARRYGAAAVVKDDEAAAFYGLGMALVKLGRDEDARVAYARARALAAQQKR